MADGPFPINPTLTGIAILYQNRDHIADRVLPRTQPIDTEVFTYWSFDLANGITVPDTLVGRRSKVNEVEFAASEKTGKTADYGLELPIPVVDQRNSPPSIDVLEAGTNFLAGLVDLDREQRASRKVFDPASYPAGNVETLTGDFQWSDPDSNPIAAIRAAMDKMLVRPNLLTLGGLVWGAISVHPKVVSAMNSSGSTNGVASKRTLADMLELDDIVVGRSFGNSAKFGQPVVRYDLWGKHASLTYTVANPTLGLQQPTFGMTVPFGTRVVTDRFDPDIGLRGGTRLRNGEGLWEGVLAPECGYFFQNAVA